MGFEFECSSNSVIFMQKSFFFQFLVFYMGFFVTSHIKEEINAKQKSKIVIYKNTIFGICLKIMDILSHYSFHILLFISMILAVFWKLAIGMWLIMVIFAIHYCILHTKQIREKKAIHVKQNYIGWKKAYNESNEIQKKLTVIQRKSTIKILIVVTSSLILLSVLARFSDHMNDIFSAYFSGIERINF